MIIDLLVSGSDVSFDRVVSEIAAAEKKENL